MPDIETRTDDGREIVVSYVVTHPGSPPQTYGPPENCDPGEAPEFEIEAAICGVDEVTLTQVEENRIHEEIAEVYVPDDEPDHIEDW